MGKRLSTPCCSGLPPLSTLPDLDHDPGRLEVTPDQAIKGGRAPPGFIITRSSPSIARRYLKTKPATSNVPLHALADFAGRRLGLSRGPDSPASSWRGLSLLRLHRRAHVRQRGLDGQPQRHGSPQVGLLGAPTLRKRRTREEQGQEKATGIASGILVWGNM